MTVLKRGIVCFCVMGLIGLCNTSGSPADVRHLSNPISEKYLHNHLSSSLPRLVMTPDVRDELICRLQSDPVVKNVYQAIRLNADEIQTKPLLERIKTGKRLLGVSREILYRINMLGIVYCVEKDPQVLSRINDEVVAVCRFPDWNPSHFLDVGEMALAVSLALDWTAGDLPPETIDLAMQALADKGLKAGFDSKSGYLWWVDGSNNWSQVCHGGLIAAALTVAERYPELSARTIRRALDNLPNVLTMYGPNGIYPEGPSYWEYGTIYSAVTISMLRSALGTDFGISTFPGFMESATFRVLTETPHGFYNFSDCGDHASREEFTLAWFAAETGDTAFYQKERFLRSPDQMGRLGRLMGVGLLWLTQVEPISDSSLPTAWAGYGVKPLVVFSGGADDPRHYCFAAVGGRAEHSHGNMDGGSFIFELDGVRWGLDCGSQSYYNLEKTGFDLWNMHQNGQRWTLLTKNNFGHSTLTVNQQLHRVDGKTELIDFKTGDSPMAVFDLTSTLGTTVNSARRTFVKDGPASLLIQDRIVPNKNTKQVTWQFITTADVKIVPDGAMLTADGKMLKLKNLSGFDVPFTVVSLDPPPLELDRRIKNLKRIELQIPVPDIGNELLICVRLAGS